jgi:putative serine protease PepD
MPKKLLLINAILIAIAAGSVVFIVRQLMAPMPMPSPGKSRPAASADAERPGDVPRPSASAYNVVAAKNLFSPSRTEAPVNPAAAAAANVPKPNLYGVVLREGAPIAYLEDPTSKRVSGYRIGDAVAGGTVQAINADSVSISRPDGKIDVRLRDPGKPRPAAQPATAATTPGAQPVANQGLPGVIPPTMTPPTAVAAPGQPTLPGQPAIVPQPGQPNFQNPTVPGRRPLPPNLLRRLPQVPTADAPQQ